MLGSGLAVHGPLLYVSTFCERLHHAAHKQFVPSSNKYDMWDKKSALRTFRPGDKVLVLLLLPGSSLQFSGLYAMEKKISDTDYVVQTPERKMKTRVCHSNVLKRYFPTDTVPQPPSAAPVGSMCAAPPQCHPSDDGLSEKSCLMPAARLRNSEVLSHFKR